LLRLKQITEIGEWWVTVQEYEVANPSYNWKILANNTYFFKEDSSMEVTEKFRNLSRQKLLESVYEMGVDYEKNSASCSQSTVAVLHEVLGFEAALVKAATSSCGGQAILSVGTCGGVIGATMVLDYYFGRPLDKLSAREKIPANMVALSNAIEMAKLLCQKYVREYGSILCPGIQNKLYGRSFRLNEPGEFKKFEEAGGHTDPSKCMSVVGNSARWVMEILLDMGVVTLSKS
jgi:hypothetical protein